MPEFSLPGNIKGFGGESWRLHLSADLANITRQKLVSEARFFGKGANNYGEAKQLQDRVGSSEKLLLGTISSMDHPCWVDSIMEFVSSKT